MWEESQKIINIIDKKTFQLGLRIGKEKPRLVKRKGTCLRRELVRIKCCAVFQRSQTANNQLLYRLSGALHARTTDLRLSAGFWL